ncbi:hypothetical protein [Desertimonas flava]|uniref:hypothetical protein n=1 Tax=Desertimonas flava TaxID=2064846 RepID=UPI000E34886C|nr:hypothetical protein [Desertimonas flava]
MLLPARLYDGIAAGEVTLAFRSWLRPTVKAGGTLITPVGQLAIDAVDVVDPTRISDDDARRAGAADADAVRGELRGGEGRQVFRIAFHVAGDDPRIALRERTELDDAEWAALRRKLDVMDARASDGPWTRRVMDVIAEHPAVVSTVLAEQVGIDRPEFKLRVRRLKALGLTESLGTGYRLSPLGELLRSKP